MPREHARLLTSIWQDADFLALDESQQRAYMMLISQAGINWAGVLSLTSRRWSKYAADSSPDSLTQALKALEAARFIVVDEDTEELLVRSFIRNDGVAKQPNVLASAIKSAHEIQSPRLRAVLATELRRLVLPEPKSAKAKWPDVVAAADEIAPKHTPEPPPKGSSNLSPNPSRNPETSDSENRRQKPLTEPFEEPSREPFTEPPGDGEGETYVQRGHLSEVVAQRSRAHARARTRGDHTTDRTITHAELAATAHVPKARQIVEAWNANHGRAYPTKTLRALAKQVDGMLADRGKPEVIDAALELWHGRADAGPGLLPHLYVDALKAAHGATNGRQTRGDKVTGWLTVDDEPDAPQGRSARADKVRGWLEVDDEPDSYPPIRAITGGVA